MDDPKHCPVGDEDKRRLLLADSGDEPAFDGKDFIHYAAGWMFFSLMVSLAFGVFLVHLVRHRAEFLTRATISFQLFIPTLLCFSLLMSGMAWQGLFMGALAALTYLVFYLWRNEIAVSAKLLSVSGHGLASNSGLILLTIVLNIMAGIVTAPLVIAFIASVADGSVVPNPLRMDRDECVDDSGDKVICCSWEPRPRAALAMGLSMVTALWVILTANQVRVFTVSGTIAQWYFSPAGTPTTGTLRRSLGHSLTSSFGTNAFGGLVLTFTNSLKNQNGVDQDHSASLTGLLASCFAYLFEYLTKFATVMASISGEGLLDAGRRVTDLLRRNLLDAFATAIWFPAAVIRLASFTFAALFGTAVWLYYRWSHSNPQSGELYPASNAAVLGFVAGGASLFVMTFVSGVLLSILDAVFVCFALDRDRHAVANAEMYEALLGVANERGALVVGPDDSLGYGAEDFEQGSHPQRC